MPKETPSEDEDQPKSLGDLLVEKTAALDVLETTQEAGDKMRSLETDSLPVTEDRRLVGTVLDRNADRKAAGHGHDPKVERVGDYMSHELIFCYEDQDRTEAARLVTEKHLKYLPIVDRDMRIVGMVTPEDLSAAKGSQHDAP